MPIPTQVMINGVVVTQASVYFCEDDTAPTANASAGGLTAAASGAQISPEFTAPSATAAITVAHIFATVFQRPVRLVQKYSPGAGTPPWTLVQGATANVAITSVPSGVGF
jgi:hypothetical protein